MNGDVKEPRCQPPWPGPGAAKATPAHVFSASATATAERTATRFMNNLLWYRRSFVMRTGVIAGECQRRHGLGEVGIARIPAAGDSGSVIENRGDIAQETDDV